MTLPKNSDAEGVRRGAGAADVKVKDSILAGVEGNALPSSKKDEVSDITLFLDQARKGEEQAAHRLFTAVYTELRRMAARHMAKEGSGHTLQATALVHEVWMRLGDDVQGWANRAHFFGAAAEAMRRILIESARRKRAARRGGDWERVDMNEVEIPISTKDEELLEVDEALEKLAVVHPRKAELVKLRYFIGLTLEEAAEILGLALSTAGRDWTFARAWLHQEIRGSAGEDGGAADRNDVSGPKRQK